MSGTVAAIHIQYSASEYVVQRSRLSGERLCLEKACFCTTAAAPPGGGGGGLDAACQVSFFRCKASGAFIGS